MIDMVMGDTDRCPFDRTDPAQNISYAALTSLEAGKMTVWASTQSPFGLKRQLVSELGFAADQVRVITPFLGGEFGGKGSSGQGLQFAGARGNQSEAGSLRPGHGTGGESRRGDDPDGRLHHHGPGLCPHGGAAFSRW